MWFPHGRTGVVTPAADRTTPPPVRGRMANLKIKDEQNVGCDDAYWITDDAQHGHDDGGGAVVGGEKTMPLYVADA